MLKRLFTSVQQWIGSWLLGPAGRCAQLDEADTAVITPPRALRSDQRHTENIALHRANAHSRNARVMPSVVDTRAVLNLSEPRASKRAVISR